MTAPERNERGHWQPGSSGNPTGINAARRAAKRRVSEILEECAPDAALKIRDLINDPDPRIALKVSCYVVDQVIGKPQTAEEQTGDAKPQTVELVINGQPVRRIAVKDEEEEAVQ